MSDKKPVFVPPKFDTPGSLRPAVTGERGTRHLFDIEFAKIRGFRPLRMDLMLPKTSTADAPTPVVVFIHGGAFMFGSRHGGLVSGPIWESLLGRGFAIATIEYRLSSEAHFPACLHDAKSAVRWLRKFGPEFGLDSERIGAWGESAGAYLAAFLGLNNEDDSLNGDVGVVGVSSNVQAAVAWYAPTDFGSMDVQRLSDRSMVHDTADSPESLLIGGALSEHPDKAGYASPLHHIGGGTAPILLIHGREDELVPYPQSVAFKKALDDAGRPAELDLVDGAGHVFHGVDRSPIIGRSTEFLAERLL